MKRKPLFHPRVFNEKSWAESYYRRNKKVIGKVGIRLTNELQKTGFSGGNILDIGCGFASVPIRMSERFPEANITGIDLAEPLLEIGRSLIKERQLEERIILKQGDACNTEFENNSFDVVICSFLLHIVESPEKLLNEINRLVKPDGKIIITDLRRGFLALFIKKFSTAYSLKEAQTIFNKTSIPTVKLTKGFFWWDYIYGNNN